MISDISLNENKMSSLTIAELTGKNHNHVLRDIRNMLEALELDESNFGHTYLDEANRQSKCYKLPKRECFILASGYDIKLRAKIIDRWVELETKSTYVTLPQTYSEALRRLADEMEKKDNAILMLDQAKTKIEEDKPKVVFAESVTGSDNSILIRKFAKDLCDDGFEIGQNRLFTWFRDNGYLNSDNEPYQNYVAQGLFEVVTRVIGDGDGTFTAKTTKITGKGQVYFAKKIKTATV